MATPEIPLAKDQIQEINKDAEFVVDENLSKSGVKTVQKVFQAQVKDDSGQPVVQTPPTQVVSVQPPYDQVTLTTQAKGPVSSSLTWFSAFWVRVIKKAMHFGWKIISHTPQP